MSFNDRLWTLEMDSLDFAIILNLSVSETIKDGLMTTIIVRNQ